MKRFIAITATAASILVGAGATASAQGSHQPGPWTNTGTSLYATGSEVWVRFFGAEARYTSSLYYICTLTSSCSQFLFQNHAGVPTPREIKINHNFAIGEEVLFKLFVADIGQTWYTGAANRNADNDTHFATQVFNEVTPNATYTILGGFEDSPGGVKDYNEFMFEVSNVSTIPVTATPEPASMALVASGLAGLGGWARRRRTQRADS